MREWLGKLAGAGPGGVCEVDGKIFYVRCDGEVAEVLISGRAESFLWEESER